MTTPEKNKQNDMGTNNPYLQFAVYMAVLIIGIGAIAIMAFPLFKGGASETFLKDMSNPAVARGVITFIFVLGTMSIAILLTISILLRQTPIQEIEKRYRLGRETLSILIGVVGTIIGYYFGIPDPNTTKTETPMVNMQQETQVVDQKTDKAEITTNPELIDSE